MLDSERKLIASDAAFGANPCEHLRKSPFLFQLKGRKNASLVSRTLAFEGASAKRECRAPSG